MVVTEHEKPKQIEGAIVEAEVTAHPIKWFARRQHRRSREIAGYADRAVHRAPVLVERAQGQVRMIAWSHLAGGLHGIAAFFIAFKIEAVHEVGVKVLKI